ncbi:hypothetical protein MK163_00005, partial [bacterium]|nr:hypothetical protein [bacterium]
MVAPIGQILALADQDEVEVSVVVVVTPVCCTLGNCGEAEDVEVAVAIVVAPVHGCFFERADALVRGHELLNIEDLLLRPVRVCE